MDWKAVDLYISKTILFQSIKHSLCKHAWQQVESQVMCIRTRKTTQSGALCTTALLHRCICWVFAKMSEQVKMN